ncbi:SDR family oxidoreductase [Halalkalibacter alkalisediminis]|uniref:SDR family oxidoreductase n=1 Tax=Halalkalibacter alkalisediminis TaxID=935616 RepID=A0ABV6NKF7_9BACI|nr:SDR family NAD(P)-dependent oxidoreductase [Halalkalibacter alkalisediminis]
MTSLLDKVAVVTGGGSGIGSEAAIRLAKLGVKVCLMDVNKDDSEKVKQQIEDIDGTALVVPCNVVNSYDVKTSIEKVIQMWGRLDIVFANAGIAGTLSPIETMDVEEWEDTLEINLKGTFLTVKYAIPHLKNKGGSIIITSSVSGNRVFSQPGFSAYSTSKAGQVAFMKMAALELARFKIRVNAICPGAIQTNIGESIHKSPELEQIAVPINFPEGDQPLEHGPGHPEQVADLVQFLASDDSSHITGTEIYIDGGESLLRG